MTLHQPRPSKGGSTIGRRIGYLSSSVATTDLLPSSSVRRAAAAERQRIDRTRSRLVGRQQRLREELARIDSEIAVLDGRDRLLAELASPPDDDLLLGGVGAAVASTLSAGGGGSDPGSGGRVLRGRGLREAAARILYRNHGAERDVHYRDWLDEVLQAGVDVVGKDPAAAFLTNVSRSPLVARGDEPGTYRIDGAAASCLRRDLAEAQAELADLVNVIAREANPNASLREHRTRLLATVRRLEVQLAEADRVLTPGDDGCSTDDSGATPEAPGEIVVRRAA